MNCNAYILIFVINAHTTNSVTNMPEELNCSSIVLSINNNRVCFYRNTLWVAQLWPAFPINQNNKNACVLRIPPLPHDYPYYWVLLDSKSKEDKVKVTNLGNLPKLQIFEFWYKFYTQHTFWNWLKRCANMKWIRRVVLWRYRADTIMSTDGRTRWN